MSMDVSTPHQHDQLQPTQLMHHPTLTYSSMKCHVGLIMKKHLDQVPLQRTWKPQAISCEDIFLLPMHLVHE